MKKVKCSGPGCSSRRAHHESDEPRGTQWIEVPDDFPDGKKAYCSIECAAYDGALKDDQRLKVLDDLAAQAQDMGMGY